MSNNIITIDGPSGSGKSFLAVRLAEMFGFTHLNSGLLYRALAYDCIQMNVDPTNSKLVTIRAHGLDLSFESGGRIILSGHDITEEINSEEVGAFTPAIAVHQSVRDELKQIQLDFANGPGLVADGRDMGTEVFPNALFKVFVQPPAEVRGRWRTDQLIARGVEAECLKVTLDLMRRDEADSKRTVSPLRPAEDAYQFDNSTMTKELSVEHLYNMAIERGIVPCRAKPA